MLAIGSNIRTITIVILILGIGLIAVPAWAAMTSTTYRIDADSINVGGRDISTSTNYNLADTIGEIATGVSTSTNYQINAGYRQMLETYISMTALSDVVMSPTIGGITGGTANGSTNTTVVTDSGAGYTLLIKASSSPAMVSADGDTIADYTPATADPDFTFSITASQAELAFTPEGSNIDDDYRDNGAACGIGSGDTADACWDALSTSNITIAGAGADNHPTGVMTTIKFRVGVGASANKPDGDYYATTTVTALAL